MFVRFFATFAVVLALVLVVASYQERLSTADIVAATSDTQSQRRETSCKAGHYQGTSYPNLT